MQQDFVVKDIDGEEHHYTYEELKELLEDDEEAEERNASA